MHSVPKHPFCFDFRAVGIQMHQNTPKHHLGPKRVDWRCPLRKTHSEVRYRETVHPGTETEPFRSVLHAEGTETLQITPNTSFWIQWRLSGVLMRKNSSEVRRLKQCIRVPKHPFCFDFRAVGIQMLQNTPKHHLAPKRVDWRCL